MKGIKNTNCTLLRLGLQEPNLKPGLGVVFAGK